MSQAREDDDSCCIPFVGVKPIVFPHPRGLREEDILDFCDSVPIGTETLYQTKHLIVGGFSGIWFAPNLSEWIGWLTTPIRWRWHLGPMPPTFPAEVKEVYNWLKYEIAARRKKRAK